MGLDNMPKTYPCIKEGTAILNDDGQLNCEATQKANQCPYQRELLADPILENAIPVYGMFGLDCWYRGKYGNYLLGQMSEHDSSFPYDSYAFYGNDNGDENSQGGISESDCLEISETMLSFTDSWTDYVKNYSDVKGNRDQEKALINDWIYAAWWLKFVGNYGNGSGVWY